MYTIHPAHTPLHSNPPFPQKVLFPHFFFYYIHYLLCVERVACCSIMHAEVTGQLRGTSSLLLQVGGP